MIDRLTVSAVRPDKVIKTELDSRTGDRSEEK